MWRWILVGIGGFALGVVATILVIAAGLFDPGHRPAPTKEWGEFPGTPKVELLDDGRKLRMLEAFVYIDPRKKSWVTHKDFVVDGASIPQVFWSIIGGPLEGPYRNASIVHDEACVRKTEPSADVHFMFYEACRCGGLGENQAKIMYAAVYHFGPHWEIKTVQEVREVIDPDGKRRKITIRLTRPDRIKPTQQPAAAVRERLEKLVKDRNPTLEELRKIDPKSL